MPSLLERLELWNEGSRPMPWAPSTGRRGSTSRPRTHGTDRNEPARPPAPPDRGSRGHGVPAGRGGGLGHHGGAAGGRRRRGGAAGQHDVHRSRAHRPDPGLRPHSWDEFAAPGAPELHFIFTVCDRAAQEVCPLWPGQPMSAHWGIPDPAAARGNEAERRGAFADAYRMLHNRTSIFVNLPWPPSTG